MAHFSQTAHADITHNSHGIEKTEKLEHFGRWLTSLSNNSQESRLLQNTREYRDFLSALHRLEHAHRQIASWSQTNDVIMTPMEEEDSDGTELDLRSLHHPPFSFLQSIAADDLVLRVFDFLDCHALVRASTSCARFYGLAHKSADCRTRRTTARRQLASPMQLLRAQEQLNGIVSVAPTVRVPTLLLPGRVLVTDAGDPEYNGIYYCTGSNGNGYVFTKPRWPRLGVLRNGSRSFNSNIGNRFRREPDTHAMQEEIQVERESELTQPGPWLRCIIAKRFSNETILWYLSKEVAPENDSHEVTQVFSFWAKLMVIGEASPDICRYPSQTSVLTRHNSNHRNDGWQNLSTTRTMQPPTVELIS